MVATNPRAIRLQPDTGVVLTLWSILPTSVRGLGVNVDVIQLISIIKKREIKPNIVM
jgi:hypothetical protein